MDLKLQTPALSSVTKTCSEPGVFDRLKFEEVTLRRTFLDDFSSFDLKSGPWTPHYAHARYEKWIARTLTGNNEQQIYVDPAYKGHGDTGVGLNPHKLRDGVLGLTASRTPDPLRQALEPFEYTSGMISSHGQFEQTYGYFEISARVPEGQGLWPAFWLLRPGIWPPEIDVMEILGHDPDTLYTSVHWTENEEHAQTTCQIAFDGGAEAFHQFGVLWTDQMIVHYLDRVPVAITETKPALDGPMYLIANLGVGGNWPGAPDQTTRFPATFEIDWIAAYQLQP